MATRAGLNSPALAVDCRRGRFHIQTQAFSGPRRVALKKAACAGVQNGASGRLTCPARGECRVSSWAMLCGSLGNSHRAKRSLKMWCALSIGCPLFAGLCILVKSMRHCTVARCSAGRAGRTNWAPVRARSHRADALGGGRWMVRGPVDVGQCKTPSLRPPKVSLILAPAGQMPDGNACDAMGWYLRRTSKF
jgi:hypothetical protein